MTDRTMPPVGPAMDALVAEALGYSDRKIAAGVPPFSGYSAAAMRALEAWRKQHPEWSIDIYFNQPCHPGMWEICLYDASGEDEFTPYDAHADTLEAAICQAILRALWALEDAG